MDPQKISSFSGVSGTQEQCAGFNPVIIVKPFSSFFLIEGFDFKAGDRFVIVKVLLDFCWGICIPIEKHLPRNAIIDIVALRSC